MKTLLLYLLFPTLAAAQSLSQLAESLDTNKTKTTGLIISSQERIIGEYYVVQGIEDRKFLLWSISKTVGSLIIGRAIQDGFLRLDEIIKGDATVKDFLQMSSGLDWDESYEEAPFKSNVVRMLYGPESVNMGEYVDQIPIKNKPGTRFKYSSGDSNLLQWYLRKKMGVAYTGYPWKVLFDPLDIKATFETDGSGVYVASSYVYMSPRDLLKIAQLILQKGYWNGLQLIPADFIEQMITPAKSSLTRPRFRNNELNYGFQIWLNTKSANGKVPLKDLPENAIFMLGHYGQTVGIFPSEKMIILRSADDRERLDRNKFFNEILTWAKKQNSL